MGRDLVAAARAGERQAFDVLVEQHVDRLFAVAYRILRDSQAAEDAVQDALVSAWTELRSLREADRFDAWVMRILVHRAYRETRRRKYRGEVGLLEMEVQAPTDDFAAIGDRDELDRGFRRLSAEHRAVLVLTYYLQLPTSEAAEVLGIPQGTVKSRVHHAIRALRGAIEAEARPLPRRVRDEL